MWVEGSPSQDVQSYNDVMDSSLATLQFIDLLELNLKFVTGTWKYVKKFARNYASTMTMVIFFHWLYFLCMQKSLEEKQVASGRGIPLFIGVIEACLFGGTSREEGREEVGFQAPKFWLNSNSNGSTCWVYWTSTWHVIWGKHCVRRRF